MAIDIQGVQLICRSYRSGQSAIVLPDFLSYKYPLVCTRCCFLRPQSLHMLWSSCHPVLKHIYNQFRVLYSMFHIIFHSSTMPQENTQQPVPLLPHQQPSLDVHLVWNHRKFTLKYPQSVPYHQLPKSLIAKLKNYFSEVKLGREAGQVIGFTHKPTDLSMDYQLAMGKGSLTKSITLTPFYRNNETGLLRYQVYKCLAVGGFSKVYLVRSHEDGRFYVMKTMSKMKTEDEEQPDLSVIDNQREINTLMGDHPFIVKLYDSFETENFAFFVLQYCPGGELFYHLKRVKRMSEDDARFYFVEILHAFEHLHQRRVLYRDLKPQNILIDADGHAKLADFGLSRTGMDSQTLSYSYCGSAEYMAPQMILRTGHSFAFDFYTLGAMLYELVVGIPPFYSQDEELNRYGILHQQVSFPSQVYLSEDLRNLLRGLLNKNPKLRLGCLKGVKEIRFHPWVGMFNPKNILSRKLIPPFVPDLSSLNFDQNQLGTDERQFTYKLKKQIRSLNLYIQTKGQSKLKLLRNRSNMNSKEADIKHHSTISRNVSPYLEKMALVNLSKLRIFYNQQNIKGSISPEKPAKPKFPEINNHNKTAEFQKLTRVYIANFDSKKASSPPKQQPLSRINDFTRNLHKRQKLIQVVSSEFTKSSSAWK